MLHESVFVGRGAVVASVIFPLLVLAAIYGLVISGLALVFRRMGLSVKRAIILSFLVFGALTGSLTAWVWPLESSIYFNVFAAIFGDQVYSLSIQYIGDKSSPQAHYTIPWIVRIPQVYVMASTTLSVIVGLFVQWVYGVWTRSL